MDELEKIKTINELKPKGDMWKSYSGRLYDIAYYRGKKDAINETINGLWIPIVTKVVNGKKILDMLEGDLPKNREMVILSVRDDETSRSYTYSSVILRDDDTENVFTNDDLNLAECEAWMPYPTYNANYNRNKWHYTGRKFNDDKRMYECCRCKEKIIVKNIQYQNYCSVCGCFMGGMSDDETIGNDEVDGQMNLDAFIDDSNK